jgi:hypothetical protein
MRYLLRKRKFYFQDDWETIIIRKGINNYISRIETKVNILSSYSMGHWYVEGIGKTLKKSLRDLIKNINDGIFGNTELYYPYEKKRDMFDKVFTEKIKEITNH